MKQQVVLVVEHVDPIVVVMIVQVVIDFVLDVDIVEHETFVWVAACYRGEIINDASREAIERGAMPAWRR